MNIIGDENICGLCGGQADDLYILESPDNDSWLPICSEDCVSYYLYSYPHLSGRPVKSGDDL